MSNISLSERWKLLGERFPAVRPGVRHGRSVLVYQITFLNRDRYYGITYATLEHRLRQHRWQNSRVGKRMKSGEAFTAEVLCLAPTRKQALEIERLAVRSGNPWGKVLNRF